MEPSQPLSVKRWPARGLMRSGVIYPLRTLAHPTDVLDGGASRGALWHTAFGQASRDHTGKVGGGGELDMQVKQWATPQAHDANGGDPARVGRYGTKAGGRNLSDEVLLVRNWATPRAEDAECAGPRHGRGIADTLNSQVTLGSNWPTTRASDGGADNLAERAGRGPNTEAAVIKWATPTVNDSKNDAEPSQFERNSDALNVSVVKHALESQKKCQLNPDWEELLMGWEIGWTDPRTPAENAWRGWPMPQGVEQYDYEPARVIPRGSMTFRSKRLKLCGNGVVPQQAEFAYWSLLDALLPAEVAA